MIKIAFLIGTLNRAGAQKMLIDVCKHLDKSVFDIYLIYWREGGFSEKFSQIDEINMIKLRSPKNRLDKLWTSIRHLYSLNRIIREQDINILQCQLWVGEIYGTLLSISSSLSVIINIQNTNDYRQKWLWQSFCFIRNKLVDKFISCSYTITVKL